MATMTQVAQCRKRQLTVEQQVGDEYDEPPPGEQRRETHQCRLRRRPLTVRRVDQTSHQSRPLSRLHSRRHDLARSEEHTSELQSHSDLVCRLLLEKKKKK